MLKKICIPVLMLFVSMQTHAAEKVSPELLQLLAKEGQMSSGDVVYVDFWASWCAPCRKSFPWMNEMLSKYQSQGFKVLAVNVDKERELADKFLSSIDINFPVFYDPEGKLAQQFKLKGMPSSFIVNSDGVILKAHKGFFDAKIDAYEQEIRDIVAITARSSK